MKRNNVLLFNRKKKYPLLFPVPSYKPIFFMASNNMSGICMIKFMCLLLFAVVKISHISLFPQ